MKKSAIILAALLITAPMTSQAFWKKPIHKPLNHPGMTCVKFFPKTGKYEKVPCILMQTWQNNSLSPLGK